MRVLYYDITLRVTFIYDDAAFFERCSLRARSAVYARAYGESAARRAARLCCLFMMDAEASPATSSAICLRARDDAQAPVYESRVIDIRARRDSVRACRRRYLRACLPALRCARGTRHRE